MKTVRIIGILGISLLILSVGSSIFKMATGATEVVNLGTFDFVIRTGGRLQEPPSEDHAYPLTHTIYDPGNMTMAEIPEIREFTIFYQVIFGVGILKNGIQTGDSPRKLERTRYDLCLDLATDIEIDTLLNQTTMPLIQIRNFCFNESTNQQIIMSKGISLGILAPEAELEIAYSSTRTPNNDSAPTSDLILTSRINRTDLADTMNITLRSEWTAHFVAPNASDIVYRGDAVVSSFRINRNDDSSYGMNGYLRCYFGNQHVSVLQGWDPLLEIAMAATGGAMITVYLTRFYRSKKN
ncbi:MAG: hypothetical protein ACFFEU_14255 [Candidatus Thorarchaeota archaeon]